ncbi:hypothetical protein [Streptomyces sp. NPDC002845]
MYASLPRRADALFELCDALLGVPGDPSCMIQSGPIGVAEQRLGLGSVGRSRIAQMIVSGCH